MCLYKVILLQQQTKHVLLFLGLKDSCRLLVEDGMRFILQPGVGGFARGFSSTVSRS